MSSRSIGLDDALYEYFLSVSLREPDVLARLREETTTMRRGGMQVSPEQGQFMRFLVELIGARRALEVGVFTGYSALSVALALPEDGRLIACDVDEDYTAMARRYWEAAGIADRIELRLAPALDTLDALIAEGRSNEFDFAFIDADKVNYLGYYERCLDLVRRGGIVAIDNTLWQGRVIDVSDESDDTEAVRALNRSLHGDERVTLSMLPVGDGLTLARKR